MDGRVRWREWLYHSATSTAITAVYKFNYSAPGLDFMVNLSNPSWLEPYRVFM
jgi:hypothetical protein